MHCLPGLGSETMSTSLNVRQTTLNWILLGLLFAALVGTGLSLSMQLQAQGWVEHTLAVRASLIGTLSTLQDVSSESLQSPGEAQIDAAGAM
jgi:hypothetical protein